MDVSKFNLFGVLFNFKDKKARDDHAALAETVGVHGEDIQGLQAPTFSEPAANANVREAVAKVKSGATLGTLFTNVKAALNGLITLGEMRNYLVNNGTVTETGKYFLDAAYGKTLLDQITALNSNLAALCIWKQHTINVGTLNAGTSKYDQISIIALPSGYTSAAIVGFSLDGANYTACSISKLIVRGNSVTWSVQNLGTATTGNLTLSLDVLCVKSKFW